MSELTQDHLVALKRALASAQQDLKNATAAYADFHDESPVACRHWFCQAVNSAKARVGDLFFAVTFIEYELEKETNE